MKPSLCVQRDRRLLGADSTEELPTFSGPSLLLLTLERSFATLCSAGERTCACDPPSSFPSFSGNMGSAGTAPPALCSRPLCQQGSHGIRRLQRHPWKGTSNCLQEKPSESLTPVAFLRKPASMRGFIFPRDNHQDPREKRDILGLKKGTKSSWFVRGSVWQGSWRATGGCAATSAQNHPPHSAQESYSDTTMPETFPCSPQASGLPHGLELAQTTPTRTMDCSLELLLNSCSHFSQPVITINIGLLHPSCVITDPLCVKREQKLKPFSITQSTLSSLRLFYTSGSLEMQILVWN